MIQGYAAIGLDLKENNLQMGETSGHPWSH